MVNDSIECMYTQNEKSGTLFPGSRAGIECLKTREKKIRKEEEEEGEQNWKRDIFLHRSFFFIKFCL